MSTGLRVVSILLICLAFVIARPSRSSASEPAPGRLQFDEFEPAGQTLHRISIFLTPLGLLVELTPGKVKTELTWRCSLIRNPNRNPSPWIELTRASRDELNYGPIKRITDVGLETDSDMPYRRSIEETWSITFSYQSPHSESGLSLSKVASHHRYVAHRHWIVVLVPFMRQYVLPACDLWRLDPKEVNQATDGLRRNRGRAFHAVLGLALASDVVWSLSANQSVPGWPDELNAIELINAEELRRERQLGLRNYRRRCERRPSGRRCSEAIIRLFSLPTPSN
jgi:hypothetical protein